MQVVSTHPVFASFVVRTLSREPSIGCMIQDKVCASPSTVGQQKTPMLFLLDFCCLGTESAALCRSLRRRCPGSKVVCLLPPVGTTEDYMLSLFYAGVEGIVCLKERWGRELRKAVRAVSRGDLWISPIVLRKYIQQTSSLLESGNSSERLLTAREMQVAHLTIRQFSTREIAGELAISERTVKFHISNIFLKTGTHSRDQLVAKLAPIGMVEESPPCPEIPARTRVPGSRPPRESPARAN